MTRRMTPVPVVPSLVLAASPFLVLRPRFWSIPRAGTDEIMPGRRIRGNQESCRPRGDPQSGCEPSLAVPRGESGDHGHANPQRCERGGLGDGGCSHG
jgi:hypothetical protein